MLEKIKTLSEKYFSETQSYRHHIHSNPELSFQEHETSAYIQAQLKSMGIAFEVKADTGIVAHVFGKNSDKKVFDQKEKMSISIDFSMQVQK